MPILLGAAGAALGHGALKKAATKRRQQKTPLKARNVASESTYATEWDKKMDGYIINGCIVIVATATIIFFVWLFI